MANNKNEKTLLIAGIDEVGRGPLAGPVMAAAVILNPERRINGLADSKVLTEEKREKLYDKITQHALAWAVGRAEVEEIDTINILQASLLAMRRAFAALSDTTNLIPELILVDGNICPKLDTQVEIKAVIQGDATIPAISAASIIAKVTRDREMQILDTRYPGYYFAKNKGYGTPEHLACIRKIGISEIHRRSFAPVRQALEKVES